MGTMGAVPPPTSTMHVTEIETTPSRNGSQYRCRCTCGWQSDALSRRLAAANAGRVHRANAEVQRL